MKHNMYNIMNSITEQLGLVQEEHPKIQKYNGVFIAGEFENAIYSYRRGLLGVTISVIVAEKNDNKILYTPFLAISTIDDGTWQAFHPVQMPLNEANEIVKNIFDNWEWEYVLPSETEFNEFLMKFGMMGSYTG